MAISREEIEEIAQAVARRVADSARACRCGMAMWESRAHTQSLDATVAFQNPAWLQPLPGLLEHSLGNVEQACGVDMLKPKELTKRLQADIESEDWREARANLALLKGAILGPVEKCAIEGEV